MSIKHGKQTTYEMGCERPAKWRSFTRDSWCPAPGPDRSLSLCSFTLELLVGSGMREILRLDGSQISEEKTALSLPTVKGFSGQKRNFDPSLFRPRYSEAYREIHRWELMTAVASLCTGNSRPPPVRGPPARRTHAVLERGWQGRAVSAQNSHKNLSLSAGRHSA